jgi:hypothetical protein
MHRIVQIVVNRHGNRYLVGPMKSTKHIYFYDIQYKLCRTMSLSECVYKLILEHSITGIIFQEIHKKFPISSLNTCFLK